ncbi:MAG TPA: SsrA-binding protein SmpB [Candidatus Omnitrophota bacterium]|nr:SsrA-binding protein SmpB [Candidatus Omnitrophota bacterium]
MDEKVIATNRKLFRDYEVLETLECGIELRGSEVKSLRDSTANIDDAFARVEGNEIYLYNCHITPYEKASYFKEEATRPRRLLLHARQIKKLIGQTAQRGWTLAPMKMYFNKRGLAKVALSLVKGKKLYDRRQDIKKREEDRHMRRLLRPKN